jgi:hypothetical protein
MSKRLQILVSEREAEQFRRSAEREGQSLSEWARLAMRDVQKRQAMKTSEQKLRALERALTHSHPTGDVEQMLAEIESGRDLR